MTFVLLTLFRVVIVGALALHVAVMYGFVRAMDQEFGRSTGEVVLAMIFGAAMLIPLVWAVTIADAPEICSRHIRGKRRWDRGDCPDCGYRRPEDAEDQPCTECGGVLRPPRVYALSRRTVSRYLAMNLVAWAIGGALAEVLVTLDERMFAAEVEATAPLEYDRPRAWPFDSIRFVYREGEGSRVVSGLHPDASQMRPPPRRRPSRPSPHEEK